MSHFLNQQRPSSESKRPRFYLVGPDFEVDPSDFAFVNEDEALIEGRTGGAHLYRSDGWSKAIGVPPLRGVPKLVVGPNNDDLLDFYGLSLRYVSSRAKSLLTSINSEDFEFTECATVNGAGVPIESYWMMDVVRFSDRIDEARSSVVRYSDRFPNADDAHHNQGLVMLNDVHFFDDVQADQAFYLVRYRSGFIFGELLADAWREAGLTGVKFTPLQPPNAAELRRCDQFENYPYWGRRGRAA